MNFTPLFLVIIYLSTSLLLNSCSGVDKNKVKSKCINKENQDVELRWGYRIKSKNEYFGYTLKTDGKVFLQNKFKIIRPVSQINQDNYCNLYNDIMSEFNRTQVLNVPADTTVYIEYVHPSRNIRLKAYWNPKFKAIGSKVFRSLWNRLDQALPNDNSNLHSLRIKF